MDAQTLTTVTEFLGWACVINIGILLFTTLAIIALRGRISRIHGQLFGMTEQDLGRAYFQYLAQYKIAILVLNFVPYIALKIMLAGQ